MKWWLLCVALTVCVSGCKKESEEDGGSKYSDEEVCKATIAKGTDPDAEHIWVEECMEKMIPKSREQLGDDYPAFAECLVDNKGNDEAQGKCGDIFEEKAKTEIEALCSAIDPGEMSAADWKPMCAEMMESLKSEYGDNWKPFTECVMENQDDVDTQAACVEKFEPEKPEQTLDHNSPKAELCVAISPADKQDPGNLEDCEEFLNSLYRATISSNSRPYEGFVSCALEAGGDESALTPCVEEASIWIQ